MLGLAGAGAGLVWNADRAEQLPATAAETEAAEAEAAPASFTVSADQAGQEWTLLSGSPWEDGRSACSVAGPGGEDLPIAPPAGDTVFEQGDAHWFTAGAVTPPEAGEYSLACSAAGSGGADEGAVPFAVTADSIPSGLSGLPLSFTAVALPPLLGGALGGGLITACFSARRRAL